MLFGAGFVVAGQDFGDGPIPEHHFDGAAKRCAQ